MICFLPSSGLTAREGHHESGPEISPDGRWVAYYSDEAGTPDIYLKSVATGQKIRLTDSELEEYGPTWSPDGRHLFYYAGADGQMEIFRVKVETPGRPERMTMLGGYVGNPSVSPNGRDLAFSWNEGTTGADHEIYIMDLETGRLTRLTDNGSQDWTPVWSPDGKRIVFNSDRRDEQFDVYVMSSSGEEVERLVDLHPHDYYANWSPDGRSVTFFGGPDVESFENYSFDLESGRATRLTTGYGGGKVSFCPDMSCLVFSGGLGEQPARVHLADSDGSDPRRLGD